ncbi:MAG: hypothetical protein KAT25_04795 [Sulfuriflexus sp.]|nr:hypothetical protein [Sulfuriflexus sp.]
MIKFVYVGQGGSLSVIPLKSLCDKGFLPAAVVIANISQRPKGLNLLPVQQPPVEGSLAAVAAEFGLPIIHWQRGAEAEIEAKLGDISPDLVIMSCFPWRIPKLLLDIPTQGWWNLHPSLLPAYRGPTPLFWQASRAGELETGVSLHQVAAELDSGAILGQQRVSMLDFQGDELEVELAQQGGKLIEQALFELAQDTLQPRAQQESDASYQGFPNHQDRCIEIIGTASAAYRFICVVNSAYPLWFEIEARQFRVMTVVSFDDEARLDEVYRVEDNQLTIQFEQGVLIVLAEEQ